MDGCSGRVPSSSAMLDVMTAEAFASLADPGQVSVPVLLVQAAEQLCAARSSTAGLLNNGIAVGGMVSIGARVWVANGAMVSVTTLVGAMTERICTQISPFEELPRPKRLPRLSSNIHTPL
jgi:uncharacterized membrane protein YqgA involved in biofilm formation